MADPGQSPPVMIDDKALDLPPDSRIQPSE
jgi:hypothetical protein